MPVTPEELEDTRRSEMAPMSAKEFQFLKGPTGIGGLLLLFIIPQVISFALAAKGVPGRIGAFQSDSWSFGDRLRFYRPSLVVESAFHVIRIIGPIVGLTMIFRRDPRVRTFYTLFLSSLVLYGAFEWIVTAIVYPQMEALIVAAGQSAESTRQLKLDGFIAALRTRAYGAIWLWYLRESTRLANTFAATQANHAPVDDPLGA